MSMLIEQVKLTYCNCIMVGNKWAAVLTVWAGLKLKLAAAAAVACSGTSPNLQQVSGIRFQSIQSHICALASQDGVAGLLFLLQETRATKEKKKRKRDMLK